jgi:hypothetical protein
VTATGERREAVGAARRRSGRHDFRLRLGRDGGEAGGASEAGCREAGGVSEAGCRDARHAVPTAALSRGVGAAHGSHTATARYRAGPCGVRRLTIGARSLAISKLKITSKENSSKQIARD